MAKNFSVEWLSQSIHGTVEQTDLEAIKRGRAKPHVPCVVQPQVPKFCMDIMVEPKIQSKISTPRKKETGEKISCNPSSPTNSFGYTSGSESEVGDDSEGETGLHRRMRTKFSTDQIYRLEKTFNKHKYLGATQRRKIAESLHLSETQVKTWFQNRRMKLKREVQDSRAEYFGPVLSPMVFPSAPSFQHHSFAGQLHFYNPLLQQVPVPQLIPQQHIHPMRLASQYY